CKALRLFLEACSQRGAAERLLIGAHNAMGHRLFPPRTPKHDHRLGFRIDQGWFNKDGTFSVVVQENGRPHGDVLAATVVSPQVDVGEDVVERLRKDAEARGYM